MKHIIITGTSRGIGFELVKLYANAGHQVLALSRNSQPITNLGLSNVTAFSFDLYVYYIAKINKLRFKRIPVLFKDRIHGKSSWNINFKSKIQFIIRTIEYSLRLKKKVKYK